MYIVSTIYMCTCKLVIHTYIYMCISGLTPQMFKLTILGTTPTGEIDIVPPSFLVQELNRILEIVTEPAEHAVGILTTEHRDTWYRVRQELIQGMGVVGGLLHTMYNYIIIRNNIIMLLLV